MERLEREVARLQTGVRRQRNVSLGLGLLLASLLLTAVAAPSQRTVEAEAFVVRDDQGRPRAQLAVSGNVPALSLYDQDGILRAALAVDAQGPILNLFAPGGEPRAVLAERERRAYLVLRDAAGAPRAAMAVQESGEPSLYLLDEDLNPIWRQPLPDQR